jgi:hypothetical protein
MMRQCRKERKMASILKFVAPPRRDSATVDGGDGKSGQCEIVIFPGARYERWSDGDDKPAAPSTKRRRRRRAD